MTPNQAVLDLNTFGMHHRDAGDTEIAGAVAVKPVSAKQRTAVYELLKAAAEGLTDREIAERLHLDRTTVIPRRTELIAAGLVRYSGRKRIYGSAVPNRVYEVTSG